MTVIYLVSINTPFFGTIWKHTVITVTKLLCDFSMKEEIADQLTTRHLSNLLLRIKLRISSI